MNRDFERVSWRRRAGYTLVEVIIVSLLLAVLMSGVWSMFQMQNRIMLQGQRISRENSAVQSAWIRWNDDLSRMVFPPISELQIPSASLTKTQNSAAQNSIALNSTSDSPVESDVTVGNSNSSNRSTSEALTSASFMFEGDKDWLIFDAKRDWRQFQAIDFSFAAAGDLNTNPGGNLERNFESSPLDSSEISLNQTVSPYQRICYAWVTTDELRQWLNIQLNASRDASTEETGESGESIAGASDAFLAEQTPKRWLLRITCDWSVGSPEVDQEWNANDSNETNSVETNLSGSSDSRKQLWLQWLLASSEDDYRRFQQWLGTIDSENITEESNLEAAQSSIDWVADRGRVQIDWMPTVVDGQFRYLLGNQWYDRANSSVLYDLQNLSAIELQYAVDPNHVPTRVSIDQVELTTDSGSMADLDSFESLDQPDSSWSQEMSETQVLDELPEFDYVCLVRLSNPLLDRISPAKEQESSNSPSPMFDPFEETVGTLSEVEQ